MVDMLRDTVIMTIVMLIGVNILLYFIKGGIFKRVDDFICSGSYGTKCVICKFVRLNKYHRATRVTVWLMATGICFVPLLAYFVATSDVISDGFIIGGILTFVVIMIPFLFIMGVKENVEAMRFRRF